MPAVTVTEALSKINNTDAADINEIMMGYYLVKENWNKFEDNQEARAQIKAKTQLVGEDIAIIQSARAKIMSTKTIQWSKENGYNGKVSRVWWTARPGVLSKAVGEDVDSRKNPTDVLIKFTNGEFLGISAKSTKTMGDIGFKNPGIGTVSKSLSIDFSSIITKAVDTLMSEFPKLSKTAASRKREIRANAKITNRAEELGGDVLNSIREKLFKKLKSMKDKNIKDYIIGEWLDAKNAVYPRYIKVTGQKVGAIIEDPMANSKLSAMTSGKIKLSKIGNDSVGITAGTKRILKMRAKFESQKLASSVKFSGDPWK